MRRALILVAAIVGCASVGCEDTNDVTGLTSTPAVIASATPPPSRGEAPVPVHHEFAPGQLIDTPDAGVFFVDIDTGEAEAWVTPDSEDNPFAFTRVSMSADGSKVIYSCMTSTSSGLAPCGSPDGPIINYLLDTQSGERRSLDAFSSNRRRPDRFVQQFVALSPDGETILGTADDGSLIRARTDDPDTTETIAIPKTSGGLPLDAAWAPDNDAAIVAIGQPGGPATTTALVRSDSTAATMLVDASVLAQWSPDGRVVALIDTVKPGLWVFDVQGTELWTRPEPSAAVTNARWSPDSASLAFAINPGGESGTPERIEVIDASTGGLRYTIENALACSGQVWNADGSLLLFGSYAADGHLVAADPETRTFSEPFDWYGLTPSPADPNIAILFDGESFAQVDLRTRQRLKAIAETTVMPAWFFDHEPFFAGDRITFTAPHLGHGGCGEAGSGVTTKPAPRFVFPPS
jgi:dipeptidyl aminopeptidase/acylaminoacyl peptidase